MKSEDFNSQTQPIINDTSHILHQNNITEGNYLDVQYACYRLIDICDNHLEYLQSQYLKLSASACLGMAFCLLIADLSLLVLNDLKATEMFLNIFVPFFSILVLGLILFLVDYIYYSDSNAIIDVFKNYLDLLIQSAEEFMPLMHDSSAGIYPIGIPIHDVDTNEITDNNSDIFSATAVYSSPALAEAYIIIDGRVELTPEETICCRLF